MNAGKEKSSNTKPRKTAASAKPKKLAMHMPMRILRDNTEGEAPAPVGAMVDFATAVQSFAERAASFNLPPYCYVSAAEDRNNVELDYDLYAIGADGRYDLVGRYHGNPRGIYKAC